MTENKMIDCRLARIVMHDRSQHHYIYLEEVEHEDAASPRGFSIVIGQNEVEEIYRVVHQKESGRPLTHQLAFTAIGALGAQFRSIDIVALHQNTFYAQIELRESGGSIIRIDARPSDAIAIGLRANASIRVAEPVLLEAMTDHAEPDEE